MGPLSEHFRTTEIVAALREAELARTSARRHALGMDYGNDPSRGWFRGLFARFRSQPALDLAASSEREGAVERSTAPGI